MLDIVGFALGLTLLAAGAAVAFIGIRRLRRKAVAALRGVTTNWLWLSTRAALEPRSRDVIRVRRDLWRAVADSEHAVQSVRASGAPLGDLPSLVRRLHDTVADLDRALQIAQRSTRAQSDGSLSRDADALLAAADQIMHSAALSLRAGVSPAVGVLLNDARQERVAFSAE